MCCSKKQIREMAKGKKTKNKNVVEKIERPNGQREQGLEEAAAAGMGLQELTAAAAEGSGGESMHEPAVTTIWGHFCVDIDIIF